MYLLGKGVDVPQTYERPSPSSLNGPSTDAAISAFGGSPDATGVAEATGVADGRRAIDVVRLAVIDRLVRSGVPVAHAAALVQAAETLANATI